MENPEIGGVVGGGGNKGGEGFIDRSKVRILFCDNDTKSSEEVCRLLCKCSYQVTLVKSARQVIDALNAEGPDIDIILAEVDLPMAKGMKMLKYITRDKGLQRIPVIMMSALDEVSVVVKCLRFGAADYLVKPLRTNELLNLWTHMWRRRRMLGLTEKNIMTYDFDLVVSDPSDANTNSTTLFSDDTDERSRKTANLEASLSTHQENESTAAATAIVAAVAAVVEPPASVPMQSWPNVSGISNHCTGQFQSGPKKSELKVGESSAFFTYVKSSFTKRNVQAITHAVGGEAAQHLMTREKLHALGGQMTNATHIHDNGGSWESHSHTDEFTNSSVPPDSSSLERSCTPTMSRQFPQERSSNEEQSSQVHMCPGNKPQLDLSGFPPQNAYPYYMSGMGNQVIIPSSKQLYQKSIHDPATSVMVSQYNPPVHGMASFPYYVNICLQPGQVPTSHPWPSFGGSPTEAKSCKVDRREAALIKFRQKRKERCFDKKIRYVNRKKLAERRPRVRGQFVRKVNGVNVDLNGEPASNDSDEEEEYEEQASRDSNSPEDDSSGYKL